MASKLCGVSEYIPATVNIYFEPGHVGCAWCPLMETYSRKQCRMSGAYILDDRTIDPWCPLTFQTPRKEEPDET